MMLKSLDNPTSCAAKAVDKCVRGDGSALRNVGWLTNQPIFGVISGLGLACLCRGLMQPWQYLDLCLCRTPPCAGNIHCPLATRGTPTSTEWQDGRRHSHRHDETAQPARPLESLNNRNELINLHKTHGSRCGRLQAQPSRERGSASDRV